MRAPSRQLSATCARSLAAAFMTAGLLSGFARPAAAKETHLLVITGVAGDDDHEKQFHKLATTLLDSAKKRAGLPDANLTYLGGKPDVDPARIGGRSTREQVEKTLSDLAARVKPNDEVFLFLIGHGSFNNQMAAFNLPGPDLTAVDWARLLDKFSAQRVIFVNTSSASGAFLPTVAAPGRTVVTATKTGGERNETRFAQFFVEAYEDEAADLDRNGRLSVLEAFNYAKTKVVKSYEQQGTLLTEHAALDDGTEGKLAATLFLGTGSGSTMAAVDISDPEMRALVGERDALDQRVVELKVAKDSMDQARYEQELERLLTDLALKTKAIRDRQAVRDGKR